MFEKVEIERFRGIRNASIQGFRRINLFFGKNNCGKSSLLEALFLASGGANPMLPVNVNFMRGYGKSRLNDLNLEFYNLDSEQPIHIKLMDGYVRDLNISFFEKRQNSISLNADDANILSNVEEGRYGLKFDFKVNNQSYVSWLRFDSSSPGNASVVAPKHYVESLRCTYLSPKYDFNASIQGLKNILQNKDEHFIIEGF